jgi:arginyl-tRNA synthetase
MLPAPDPDKIHIHVLLSSKTLPKILIPYIHDRGARYGLSATETPKPKVVVEFSSPNIARDFTGAHLRSTIIGSALSTMLESSGHDVVRLNYLGDWGAQIGLLAAAWTRLGSEEIFAEDPLRHILEIYNKIDALFKPKAEEGKEMEASAELESRDLTAERDAFFRKMEDGDADALALWTKFKDASIAQYKKLYGAMGVSFDEYSGESAVNPAIIGEVESRLKEAGVYEESEGAWAIDFKKHEHKGLGFAVLRNRTGSTLYLLRHVAAAIQRYRQHKFDKMMYVAAEKQELHFRQIKAALEMLGEKDLADKLQHAGFKEVEGLHAPEGKGLLLSDIIERCEAGFRDAIATDAEEYAAFKEADPKTIDQVGMSALLVQELSVRRGTVSHFDLEKMFSLDPSTGFGLQSIYNRLCAEAKDGPEDVSDLDYTPLEEVDEYAALLRTLAQFPDVAQGACKDKTMEPSLILQYLGRVAGQLKDLWAEDEDSKDELDGLDEKGEGSGQAAGIDEDDDEEVGAEVDAEGSEEGTSPAERALYEVTKQVMENGMRMIGLQFVNM